MLARIRSRDPETTSSGGARPRGFCARAEELQGRGRRRPRDFSGGTLVAPRMSILASVRIRSRFFQAMLNEVKAKRPELTNATRVDVNNRFAMSAGRSGFGYNC